VTRDVLELKYRLRNNEIEAKRIKFDLYIKEWTENGMTLQLKFKDPLLVSYGNMFDLCYIKIKNPHLFVTKATGDRLPADYETLNDIFPKQVSKDVDFNAIDIMSKQCFYVFLAFTILFLVSKLFLMGSILDCWVLIYACQMVMYLNIYKVYMPANVMTFLVEFKKLIEFDWLNPIKYYTWFKDNKFRLSDYLSGTEPLPFDNEDQTFSIIDELQFYVLLIMLFAFVSLFMWMCRYSIFWSRRTRHWFRDSLQLVNETVFFNWTIRFITVMYIQLCITNFN
jgi:hypothetical protein